MVRVRDLVSRAHKKSMTPSEARWEEEKDISVSGAHFHVTCNWYWVVGFLEISTHKQDPHGLEDPAVSLT